MVSKTCWYPEPVFLDHWGTFHTAALLSQLLSRPRVESTTAAQLKVEIAQLASQEEEEAAFLDQLAKGHRQVAQRKACAAQNQEINRETERYGAPLSVSVQAYKRGVYTAAAKLSRATPP
eukprot:2242918-Pleurochrysis_carterae.AAC.1